MSHRLENVDTKYHGYKEPKMSRRHSTSDYKERQENTRPDTQFEDAETVWSIARESESNKNRGSFADEHQSVENVIKKDRKLNGVSNPEEEE